MQPVFRKEIMPRVYLTWVPAEKFKSGIYTVNLVTPLNKSEAALNAVLPKILRRGTSGEPTMDTIAARLDMLYGAKIEPTVRKIGERQIVGLAAFFADDAFVPEKILEDVIALTGEMLISPATAGGRLKAEYVEGEREKLSEEIRSIVNDRRRYADMRLIELMCQGGAYAVPSLGHLNDVEKITVYTATKRYREILPEADVEVFYCGSASLERVEMAAVESLAALPRGAGGALPENLVLTEPKGKDVREFTETLEVAQGKLSMGYRLGDAMKSPNYAALAVMNGVFGGCVTSKLFRNVREKLSLCYYAGSRIDKHKGIMLVSSGIDPENYEKAVSAITGQLEAVKAGDFTDAELESAKKELINAYRSGGDSLYALEGWYLDCTQTGVERSQEDMAALVSIVTKEDVLKAASGIKADAVYFLKGGEDSEA